MRRRSNGPFDSTELLLDTMCNAFGSIILIALLIALVARDAPVDAKTTRPNEGESAQKAEDLQELERYGQELRQRMSDPAARERKRLLETKEALVARLDALHRETETSRERAADRIDTSPSADETLRELTSELEAARVERESLDSQRRQLERSTAEARSRLEALQRQRTAMARQDVRALRLPREHATSKQPLDMIVRYGKFYPVHLIQNGNPARNSASLDWVQRGGGLVVEPKRDQGAAPGSEASARLLRQAPTDAFYLIFHVYADSFDAFNRLKKQAIELGFEYTWAPLENDTPLKAGGTQGAPPPPL